MKIEFQHRPTCSCGVKMKLIEYKGYYDKFNYWSCDNCELEMIAQDAEPDNTSKGAYA